MSGSPVTNLFQLIINHNYQLFFVSAVVVVVRKLLSLSHSKCKRRYSWHGHQLQVATCAVFFSFHPNCFDISHSSVRGVFRVLKNGSYKIEVAHPIDTVFPRIFLSGGMRSKPFSFLPRFYSPTVDALLIGIRPRCCARLIQVRGWSERVGG